MPRVLIAGFCAVPSPNRTGVQLGHVLGALAPHHTLDVLSLRKGDQAYVERQSGIRLLRVPLHDDAPRSQIEAFRRALRRQLEGADYDIVQFRDGWAGIPVLEMRERLGYAAVFDAARSPMAEPQALSLEMSSELSRDHEACLLGADLVLAPSEPARRFLAARGRPDRVCLVPPGVDVDEFDWDYPPEGEPPRILYVGSLEPGRGVRVLLRAMVDVVSRSSAILTLAGPSTPQFADSLRAAVSDLGLDGRVELPGAIEHARVPALIASATVCVAPAAVELSPRPIGLYPTKILEYMACRRPVVAPRRGTVTMLMKDGVHGLLFNPGDPADLARALLALMARPELRQRLADSAYEMVRRQHTASATRRSMRAAYATLAARSPWRERFAVPQEVEVVGEERVVAVEELDATDFHEEFPAGAGAGATGWVEERVGSFTAPGDITRVDARVRATEDLDRSEWATMEASASPGGDDWIVTSPNQRALEPRWEVRDEDEGTPLDVAPVRTQTVPVDSRFVAGEVDVPTPPPQPDEPTSFTAVSVLLGGTDEDATPGPTPAVEPTSRPGRALPAERPVRARRPGPDAPSEDR